MKLLLGAKKYLEECELRKEKDMEPGLHEENEDFSLPEQNTLKMRLLVSAALQPIDCAKHLIMLGYEPMPPFPAPWLGRSYFMYPNVFKYVGYIYSVDGLLGCFRGLVHKSTNLVIQNSLITYLDKKYPAPEIGDSLISKLKRNVTVKCICTLAAHPLQLMTVRCMAQFVGRETLYSEWNPLANLLTILKLEGLAGLLKGFWAKLAGEVLVVASSVIIMHGIYSWRRSRDEGEEKNNLVVYSTVVNLACTSYLYPFTVIAATMSVNQAGLKLGEPPLSVHYRNSYHCYSHLSYMNQLKRGSAMVFRWVPTISKSDGLVSRGSV